MQRGSWDLSDSSVETSPSCSSKHRNFCPFECCHMAVCQNLVPLVNPKIAGKWMFIPLKMYLLVLTHTHIVSLLTAVPCCHAVLLPRRMSIGALIVIDVHAKAFWQISWQIALWMFVGPVGYSQLMVTVFC